MFNPSENTTISVSTWSIIRVFLILILLWVLYQIREVLLIVFVAVLLSWILERPVAFLQRKKIPRALGMTIIYVILLSVVSLITFALVPPLTDQLRQLATTLPTYLQRFLNLFPAGLDFVSLQRGLEALARSLATGTTTNVVGTVFSFFGGFVSTIVVLVMTFYLVVEEDAIRRVIRSITPDKYQPYLTQVFNQMQSKLGEWLRGQLILSLTIGCLVYIALSVIQVLYALVLAIMAGLFEFIPYIGPITAALPAVLIALTQSPFQALMVIASYIVIQQLENHILVPKIMQKAVGLNPVVSIVALLIGVKTGGIIGAIVAIPVAAALSVLVKDIYEEVKKE